MLRHLARYVHPVHRSRRTAKSPSRYGVCAAHAVITATTRGTRSRSLKHGAGPGIIESPASLEYTGCD